MSSRRKPGSLESLIAPHMPYYVYIVTNRNRSTLYTGFTSNLATRMEQHKDGDHDGFSSRYNTTRLVYCEEHDNVHTALQREKRIKRWHRAWKEDLIESINPTWDDLSEKWRL